MKKITIMAEYEKNIKMRDQYYFGTLQDLDE